MIPAKTPAFQRPLLLALLALVALLLQAGVPPARAQAGQTITVANGDVAGLIAAIEKLNANGGGTIDLANDGTYSVTAPSDWWYGPNAFPAIASAITVNGNGATIKRATGSPKFRFFFVSSGFSTLPAGNLTLNNLTLSGGLAQGGSGANGLAGGGGGAGLGGAIYNQGTLTLSSVAFTSNMAQGGSPGTRSENASTGAGGGLGGNGAELNDPENPGGGGGGFKTDGPSAGQSNFGMGGSFLGVEGGSPCSSGISAYGGNGGNSVGKDGSGGGGGGFSPGENGGNSYVVNNDSYIGGSAAQGGGTGGGGLSFIYGACGGGGGAFGGGGGGGASYGNGGGGGVGGGGGGSGSDIGEVNAQGGFGGGGAGGRGVGGFGGGGGGNYDPGAGGQSVFAGGNGIPLNGLVGGSGGGGAGLGGAIFNHLGTLSITNSTFTSNSAAGTSGGGTASGFGGAIFNLNGNVTVAGGSYSSDTALDSNGNADGSAFLYNLSHNAGNAAANQTPTAIAKLSGFIPTNPSDVITNQVNGIASTGAGQVITITAPSSPIAFIGGSSFTVSASSTSGLPVKLTCNTNEAMIVGSGSQLTVSPQTPSTLVFNATQGGNSSYVPASASLTLVIANPVPTPVFSLAPGTYTGAQTVTISDSATGSSIYYTTNGTTPTAASTLYTGAVVVNSSETLSAVATASGLPTSAVASAAYSLVTPAPTFNPAVGSPVTASQTIAIADSAAGAVIYYTSGPQGTVPTTRSPVYFAPIPVASLSTSSNAGTSSAYLSAIAQAPGMAVSSSAGGLWPVLAASPIPTFSPAPGSYTSAQTVTLSAPLSAGGVPLPVAIYYTTNGSTPTFSSTQYSGPIAVSATEIIKAISLAEEGPYATSAVASGTYTITLPAATPTFSPAPGTYTSAQTVTIADTTAGATLYYTTNGTPPTTSSTKYTGPISVSTTETLEAIAVAASYSNSAVATVKYTIVPTAATPVFSPAAGTYTSVQSVTIADTTAGATLYYTTNGTAPTSASTKYTGPITVSATEQLQAIAVEAGYTESAVAAAAYAIVGSPSALASAATATTATSATLNGIVNDNGIVGSYQFQYGTSASALTSTTTPAALTASSQNVAASTPLTGLVANTTYYFTVVVATAGGSASAAVLSFKTP